MGVTTSKGKPTTTDETVSFELNTEPTKTIYERLVAAQTEIGNVAKNATNPHFKSKFVDLAQLTEAAIPVLNKHGLFFMQRVEIKTSYKNGSLNSAPILVTQLFDVAGNSLPASEYPIIAKDDTDPQKFGAGLTYARRYAMMAYLGIAPEDDDGNTAATPKPSAAMELGTLLKQSGVTSKEKLADILKERYNGNRTALSQLTPDEIKAWVAELKTKDVPF